MCRNHRTVHLLGWFHLDLSREAVQGRHSEIEVCWVLVEGMDETSLDLKDG